MVKCWCRIVCDKHKKFYYMINRITKSKAKTYSILGLYLSEARSMELKKIRTTKQYLLAFD